MMRFFDPTISPMPKVIRRVELTLLGVTILMHLVNKYALKIDLNNWYFLIFCGVVVLLSWTTPFYRSSFSMGSYSSRDTTIQELYAMVSMLVMVIAEVFGEGTGIMFYWTIVKFSVFLPLSSTIAIVSVSGVAYTGALSLNYHNFVINAAKNGVVLNMTPQALVIGQLSIYLGISTLCVLLSSVYALEQRSRLRAEVLTQEMESLATELERKRISRDIHDGLGHTLTTLDIQLELAQKLRIRNPQQALEAIDQAKILTTQCLQDVRLALHNIRQEPFDLHQSLLVLTDRLRPSLNMHVQLDLPKLPVQPSHQLYCILQEGLTNIQKHAAANEVHLRGWYDADNLWVQLQDDGQGFESTEIGQGLGLRSMSERAQLLGGNLEVQSNHTQGTCLSLSIPLVAR
jgi:signal transduction histidine kinase